MIYGVLLAAGLSSRMGQPKQLLPWRGQPLVRHVAETALASRLAGLVVVLGTAAPAVRAAIEGVDGRVDLVECADYAAGMAASLRCGLAALPTDATAAVILLVDQPLVRPDLINRLIVAFDADPDALAIVPRYQGRRGNPALVAARLFAELRGLAGDMGAREVLAQHAAEVRWIEVDDPAVILDADTPEVFEQLRLAGEDQER